MDSTRLFGKHMSVTDNEQLDKIINDGKVNTSTAMVIFAVELKSQGANIEELKKAINNDNKRYVSIKDYIGLEKRVSRLENAILGVLGFVFISVVGALITLVVRK
jgi:hypothetical protein